MPRRLMMIMAAMFADFARIVPKTESGGASQSRLSQSLGFGGSLPQHLRPGRSNRPPALSPSCQCRLRSERQLDVDWPSAHRRNGRTWLPVQELGHHHRARADIRSQIRPIQIPQRQLGCSAKKPLLGRQPNTAQATRPNKRSVRRRSSIGAPHV